MRLAEIMNTQVRVTSPLDKADTAYELMRRHEIHHLVVLDGGRVVGVLSDRDLGGRNGAAARRGKTVAELMSSHTVSATPRTSIKEAANLLRGRGIGCLPVLERRKLVGIVTAADLLELLGRGMTRPNPQGQRAYLTRATPRYGGAVGARA
jgi:acetoin utilization protein AcuB